MTTGDLLLATAASIAFVHTILGPDHYLPFAAMGRVRGWRTAKLFGVTLACGAAHVASAVVLGLVGVALGISATRLEASESMRRTIAAAWGGSRSGGSRTTRTRSPARGLWRAVWRSNFWGCSVCRSSLVARRAKHDRPHGNVSRARVILSEADGRV
ncbi:MAG: hypothetical protein ACRD2J_07985 [Thermoanaerobaculia bacterium]